MHALDLDGTILNYGGHATEETRYNLALLPMLPPPAPVAIVTNQGGIAFSRYHPDRYPTPLRVAARLNDACNFLRHHGYQVAAIYASCYHPKAKEADIQAVAQQLRELIALIVPAWRVYTTARSRKPSPLMLRAAGATAYYGDSAEDAEAAAAAGIPFVAVPRFQ